MKVKVHQGDVTFEHRGWKKLRVGDMVKVEKDEFFPANHILHFSSYEKAICYVEIMNLNEGINLKLKHTLELTSNFHDDFRFQHFKAIIKCEDPNASLYSFVGNMELKINNTPPYSSLTKCNKLSSIVPPSRSISFFEQQQWLLRQQIIAHHHQV